MGGGTLCCPQNLGAPKSPGGKGLNLPLERFIIKNTFYANATKIGNFTPINCDYNAIIFLKYS